MAKSPKKRSESPGKLAQQVDRLDREIVKLLNERAKCEIRRLQAQTAESSTDAMRLPSWTELNSGPLSITTLNSIARELESGCRALVRPIRVSYLGPQYSYSHQAAVERFGGSAQLSPVATISAVFDELRMGHADFGLVPIENSTDGRIVDTLGMFARAPARICGEIQLRIHHNLLAKCSREAIQEVYSKPQAISQCREWLAKHLPGTRLVEMASTAAAAQLAAEKAGAAAIASRQAATNYGLPIVVENIEDNSNNITRFAVIGGETPRRTGRDKTALMFELAHRPGSLSDAMAVFKRGGLNLTWIESFPMPGTEKEYLFFVELEGHADDARVHRAIDALRRRTVRLDILGSYPKYQLLG